MLKLDGCRTTRPSTVEGRALAFVKTSDARHRVEVTRDDGSSDRVELDSLSFLRHDLAHYAVEVELDLRHGVWGSVAAGGSLDGDDLDGSDMTRAESLAGPRQTMMRTAASVDEIRDVLTRVAPTVESSAPDLAERLHDRFRRLAGQWASIAYGESMHLHFPSDPN